MIDGLEVVRHPRARIARLSVDPATGRVRLTVPKRMALKQAIEWASDKRDWIAAQRARLPVARPFVPGAVLPVADRAVRLAWDEGASRVVRLVDGAGPGPDSNAHPESNPNPQSSSQRRLGSPAVERRPSPPGDPSFRWDDDWGLDDGGVATVASCATLTCGGPPDGYAARIERWLKREALRVLTDDTAHYAAKAGVAVTQVAVGDPKARWGSCSASGTIRYSWRLLLAPGFVRRSTAAHEVAHRIHMHHGPEFHALVARLSDDDPQAARAWLRRDGAGLHWYGRASSS